MKRAATVAQGGRTTRDRPRIRANPSAPGLSRREAQSLQRVVQPGRQERPAPLAGVLTEEVESAHPIEIERVVRSGPLQLLTELRLTIVVVSLAKGERRVVAIARKLRVELAPCRDGTQCGSSDTPIERQRDSVGIEIVDTRAARMRHIDIRRKPGAVHDRRA